MKNLFHRARDLWAPDRLGAFYQLSHRLSLGLTAQRRGLRTTTLPWGLSICVDVEDIIGRTIWNTGVYELGVSEAIWRLLDPGDTALDIGANIGYMTSIMALRVGPGGSVNSFEPHPGVCRTLRENLRLFRRDPRTCSVELHETALGSENAKAPLVTQANWAENQGTARFVDQRPTLANEAEVNMRRLDDLISARPVALAKLDVEGYETPVLMGAERLIDSQCIRTLIYEDHTAHGGEPRTLLEAAGYTVYLLDRSRNGLLLRQPDSRPTFRNEATNFVATLVPSQVQERLSPPGWRLLDRRFQAC